VPRPHWMAGLSRRYHTSPTAPAAAAGRATQMCLRQVAYAHVR
jgi:hypothetical protein